MKLKELFSRLREGNALPVYAFCGCEGFLKEEAFRRLKKLLISEGAETLDCATLDNPSVSQIIENAETFPFLSTKRLILIRGLSFISKNDIRANNATNDDTERFLAYIQSLPPTCCIAIDCGESVDKRSRVGKVLSQLEGYVVFDPLDESEIISFLINKAKRANVELQRQACERLLFSCGNDLHMLLNELEKLIAYEDNTRRITPRSVEVLSLKNTEIRVFDMIDNTIEGKTSDAYQQLSILLASGETRLGIISLVARQVRQMLYVESMQDKGKTLNEMSSTLGIKPFLIGKMLNRSRRIGKDKLQKQLKQCIQSEFDIKNGTLNEEEAVNQILFSFSDL